MSDPTGATDAHTLPRTTPAAVLEPEPRGEACLLWHKRDLRLADHAALAAATAEYETVIPVFVFDPYFYGDRSLACDARIQFLHESLQDLDRQYRSATDTSTGISYLHAKATEILPAFTERGWDIVTMAPPTGRYGLERREQLQQSCGDRFRLVSGDGLRRDVADPRDGWQEQMQDWFGSDQYDHDLADTDTTVEPIETGVTLARVAKTHEISPSKTNIPVGGTARGREKLTAFLDRIEQYPGNISAPLDARTGTSQLSPYLKFGCLSVRQVYQTVEANAPDCRGKTLFRSRLYWNKHYTQKLLDWPAWTDTTVNPVMEGFNDEHHDPELVAAWKQGRTGFPMVDASMRCLVETGWLNFRMRAMGASFFADLLMQPWQIGADFYHYHLVDSDPAINYTQWQSQAGATGTNLMRVYNPRKQVRDNDPDGEFIRTYVPELADLPTAYLDQPEKTPLSVQRSVGVRIGEDYPYPIIDYERARARIYDRYDAVKAAAKQALTDPAVRRRASLSNRGGRAPDDLMGTDTTEMEMTDDTGQLAADTSDAPAQKRLSSFE